MTGEKTTWIQTLLDGHMTFNQQGSSMVFGEECLQASHQEDTE